MWQDKINKILESKQYTIIRQAIKNIAKGILEDFEEQAKCSEDKEIIKKLFAKYLSE